MVGSFYILSYIVNQVFFVSQSLYEFNCVFMILTLQLQLHSHHWNLPSLPGALLLLWLLQPYSRVLSRIPRHLITLPEQFWNNSIRKWRCRPGICLMWGNLWYQGAVRCARCGEGTGNWISYADDNARPSANRNFHRHSSSRSFIVTLEKH